MVHRYFLTDKSSGAMPSFFNFGGASSSSSSDSSSSQTTTSAAQAKQVAAEEAKKLKKQADERRAAAEARKREAEEKRAAAVDARKREAEEKRAVAIAQAEVRKNEIEDKRVAALQAAEERKRDAESKRAKAAVAKVKQAEKVITSASSSKPSRTISLFGFGNVNEVEQQSPDVVIKQAPRGVPIIKSWKLNRDGSLSGFISGSPNYDDGEVVTTSKIKGSSNDIVGGSVVQTGSGSR